MNLRQYFDWCRRYTQQYCPAVPERDSIPDDKLGHYLMRMITEHIRLIADSKTNHLPREDTDNMKEYLKTERAKVWMEVRDSHKNRMLRKLKTVMLTRKDRENIKAQLEADAVKAEQQAEDIKAGKTRISPLGRQAMKIEENADLIFATYPKD